MLIFCFNRAEAAEILHKNFVDTLNLWDQMKDVDENEDDFIVLLNVNFCKKIISMGRSRLE